MTTYAIRHRETGWFWISGHAWSSSFAQARTFEFMADAEIVGILECPIALQAWTVVPIGDGLAMDAVPDAHLGAVEV